MKRKRVALVGCGKLSAVIAEQITSGCIQNYELVGVLGQNYEKGVKFAEKYKCRVCKNIEQLMELKPDYTIEAASGQAVREYCRFILNKESHFIVLSMGAFADNSFYCDMKNVAETNACKIYIPSGAVGGLDIIQTLSLMNDTKVKMKAQFSPETLRGTPIFYDELIQSSDVRSVFSGTAKEAIQLLHNKVNVSIAVQMANEGAEDVGLNIETVPNSTKDKFEIIASSKKASAKLVIESKDSEVAAWSVVALLKNIVSPVVLY